MAELAGGYREQMQLYSTGVSRLWPGLAVKPYLLFTACNALVGMEESVT